MILKKRNQMNNSDIWESLPFPCILTDLMGSVVDINNAGEFFLNTAKNTIFSKSIQQYLRVDLDLKNCMQNCYKSNGKTKFEDISITINGENIVSDMWIELLKKEFLFVFYPKDNHRLKNAYLSEHATQSVVSMAEMLTHEIKNPIAGITGAAQLLDMTIAANDRKLTKLIIDETKRILNLVRQFDTFGDLRQPELKIVNIHHIIENSKKISKLSSINNILIRDIYDPSLPDVLGDQIQLEQVFVNLIQNSIDALKGKKNGEITFRTFYEKGLFRKTSNGLRRELPLQIQIEDNGTGIPDHLFDKIFDPFITGSVNGTGLGLSLVSKIVLAHNGFINATRVNNLTRFKISMPIA